MSPVVSACLITLLLASPAARAADVQVTDAWARATVPGQQVSGAYMQIEAGADMRLVGVASPAAVRVEVHEMRMDGDVMRMRKVATIDLPQGKVVVLKPGGYHIMLMNLKKPLAPGDIVPLKLELESDGKSRTLEVNAVARAPGSHAPAPHP